MFKVDLNSDLGESFGNYKIGNDDEIIKLVSSVNVACGAHAGDPLVMDITAKRVAEAGICIGAHPGYPDMQGFGRRAMALSPEEAKAYVIYQVGALNAFAKMHGLKLQHVKPHGALYNTAGKNYDLALAIAQGVKAVDENLILMGLAGSMSIKAAKDIGLRTAEEVFADRAYEDDGSLRARTKEGSMITDENESIQRVIRMVKEGKVRTYSGNDIDIKADSICVHGDGAKALLFVQKIRQALADNGVEIAPISEFI